MLFSSDWQILFVVLSILKFSAINCDLWSEHGTVSSMYATKGDRSYMEDTFIRIESDYGVGIYGIFDGHGGDYASKYAAGFFPEMIHDESEKFANDPESFEYTEDSKINFELMLRDLIAQAEAHLEREYVEYGQESGTTCLLVIAEERKLTVANLGDSRGVMCNFDGDAIDLSTDHKPNSWQEKERIEELEGVIYQQFEGGVWRVNGLAMSRALGDHGLDFEKKFIIAVPDIFTYDLDEHRPKFMILASDGIWDAISSQGAVDFIKERLTQEDFGAEQLAKHVRQRTRKGLTDNITVVIIKFDKNGHYEVGSAST